MPGGAEVYFLLGGTGNALGYNDAKKTTNVVFQYAGKHPEYIQGDIQIFFSEMFSQSAQQRMGMVQFRLDKFYVVFFN